MNDLTDEQVNAAIVTMWHRPRNPVECAERWAPAQPHTCFIIPFLFEGLTQSGLYVDHDFRLPRVFGLVLKRHHSCNIIADLDIVMFLPHAYDEYSDSRGDTLFALHERSVRAILDFSEGPMKLTPVGNYLAVEPVAREERSKGGVIMPDTAVQHGPMEGVVAFVSRDLTASKVMGTHYVAPFAPGQRIIFSAYHGSEIKVNERAYVLIKTTDVVALLEEDSIPDLQTATA